MLSWELKDGVLTLWWKGVTIFTGRGEYEKKREWLLSAAAYNKSWSLQQAEERLLLRPLVRRVIQSHFIERMMPMRSNPEAMKLLEHLQQERRTHYRKMISLLERTKPKRRENVDSVIQAFERARQERQIEMLNLPCSSACCSPDVLPTFMMESCLTAEEILGSSVQKELEIFEKRYQTYGDREIYTLSLGRDMGVEKIIMNSLRSMEKVAKEEEGSSQTVQVLSGDASKWTPSQESDKDQFKVGKWNNTIPSWVNAGSKVGYKFLKKRAENFLKEVERMPAGTKHYELERGSDSDNMTGQEEPEELHDDDLFW